MNALIRIRRLKSRIENPESSRGSIWTKKPGFSEKAGLLNFKLTYYRELRLTVES